jgi:hypothetical protein
MFPFWHQACAERIFEDVPRNPLELFIVAQDPVEETILPKVDPPRVPCLVSTTLSDDLYERDECRVLAAARHQHVEVIRHEAVRKFFEVVFGGGAKQLRFNKSHERGVVEVPIAAIGAERQDVVMAADVVERS